MLLSITKNEILYSIYISSFEQIRKNSDKNDKNYTTIQSICDNMNKSKDILSNEALLEKYSLILVKPVNKITNKILEIILQAYEQIIKDNLVNDIILQKITTILINNINSHLSQNEISNKLSQKILGISEYIYNSKNIFIHNDNFKALIQIGIKISLNEKENNNNKSIVKKTFIFFVNKIFNNIGINNEIEHRIINISFMTKLYIYFLIDLIEIQSHLKEDEKNIISKYKNLIQNQLINNNNY